MGIFDFFRKTKKKQPLSKPRANLTITQEMVSTFLNADTVEKAKGIISKRGAKVPIDSENISFRLIGAKDGNVNFEVMIKNELGLYFKPIGFFTNENEFTAYIVKEFEKDFEYLKDYLKIDLPVKPLSIQENGYIAVASKEVFQLVQNLFNSPEYDEFALVLNRNRQYEEIIYNGLTISIKTSMMGSLEANIEGDDAELMEDSLLAMFQNDEGISLHTTEEVFYDMKNKELLTGFQTN